MAVYVDSMQARYRNMIMCHMIADTLAELHEMADRIGMKRKWFQKRASFPHYDICREMKQAAIAAGAIPVKMRELGIKMRELRGTVEYSPEALQAIATAGK